MMGKLFVGLVLSALFACGTPPAAPPPCQTAFTDAWQVSSNGAVKSVALPASWCGEEFSITVDDGPGGIVRVEHSYFLEQPGDVLLSADARPGCAATKIALQVNDTSVDNGSSFIPVSAGAGHVVAQVSDGGLCKSVLSVRFSAWPRP